MEDKKQMGTDNGISFSAKRTWVKPSVEVISHNVVESGQAGKYDEAAFTGLLGYASYHS
jgi:hypothetical protein